MDVEIRELRDGLSKHLAMVREGHILTVTDHGRSVARIVPVGQPTNLESLVSEGKVTPPRKLKSGRSKPIKTRGPVSDLIGEQRR